MTNFINIIFYFILIAINIFSLLNTASMHDEIVELKNLNVEHLKKIDDFFSNLKVINAGNYVWLMLIFSLLATVLVFLNGSESNAVIVSTLTKNHQYISDFLKDNFNIINKNILEQTHFIDSRFLNISSIIDTTLKCSNTKIDSQDVNKIFKGLKPVE